MFNNEFYPTPENIILQMISPYKEAIKEREIKHILDPSAGKGDILDCISKFTEYYREKYLYAIEIEPDLQYILQEKHYKVIDSDFLQYNGKIIFDLVVMNPPFSNGDEHLLKAWDMLHEGDIVCLLNKETVDNPCNKQRKLLQTIIKENKGTVEYLGKCFSTAERKTNVDVVMVRLKKVANKDRFDFFEDANFHKTNKKIDLNENNINQQVARNNAISNMVDYYNASSLAVENCIKAFKELAYYIEPFSDKYDSKYLIKNVGKLITENPNSDGYNDSISLLRNLGWSFIFNRTKISSLMTSKTQRDFERFRNNQCDIEFTEENIQKLFELIFLNRGAIMEKCVTDVWDLMTSYAPENKIHWEGWKTNDTWKVNTKVIMPNFINYDRKSWCMWKLSYKDGELNDIDKAMCYISGKKMENITTIRDALDKTFDKMNRQKEFECKEVLSTFFQIKVFKKGTIHLKFKDEFLWQEFNIRVAKGKNWLPA